MIAIHCKLILFFLALVTLPAVAAESGLKILSPVPGSQIAAQFILSGNCNVLLPELRISGDLLNPGKVLCTSKGTFKFTAKVTAQSGSKKISVFQRLTQFASAVSANYKYAVSTAPPPPPSNPGPQPSVAGIFVSPSGSNSAAGTLAAPFKTITYAASKLTPGSTLWVRGGTYEESLIISKSGAPGQSIKIAAYGSEKPILSGTSLLSSFADFTKVKTAEVALISNPHFAKLYRARIPAAQIAGGELRLTENGRFLKLAQIPSSDERVLDDKDSFALIETGAGSLTTLGSSFLVRPKNNYWVGNFSGGKYPVMAAIWSRLANNHVLTPLITASSGDMLIFEALVNPINLSTSDPASSDRIAIMNHPEALKAPGQYVYYLNAAGDYIVYVWPEGLTANNIGVVTRAAGIITTQGAGDHVVIDGLQIEGYGNTTSTRSGGIIIPAKFVHTDFQVRNVIIKNVVGMGINLNAGDGDIIENCEIRNVQMGRGIFFGSSKNAIARGNFIDTIERAGIYFGTTANGQAINNTVHRLGIHGNGISAYQDSSNILIAKNTVISEGIGVTVQRSSNIFIFDNIVSTTAQIGMATWDGNFGEILVANNLIYMPVVASSFSLAKGDRDNALILDFRNNITSGGLPDDPIVTRKNNLFEDLAWWEQARYGWAFAPGEKLIPAALVPSEIKTVEDVDDYLTSLTTLTAAKGVAVSADVLLRYNVRAAYQSAGIPFLNNNLSDIGPLR